MSADPLYFLKETSANASQTHVIHPASMNYFAFIGNMVLVLILIYITLIILRFIMKNTPKPSSYLLKEVILQPQLKLQYIRTGHVLYILANSNGNLTLLDKLEDEEAILKALTESDEELTPEKPSKNIILSTFQQTLKSIIKNSNDLEEKTK